MTTHASKSGAWTPVGPQGLLVKTKYTTNRVFTNTTGSDPSQSIASASYTVPTGGVGLIRISWSYNQFTGANLTRVIFSVDGGGIGYRTIIPSGGGASGGTLSAIVDSVAAGAHTFEVLMQSFAIGASTFECSTDGPAWIVVEGI